MDHGAQTGSLLETAGAFARSRLSEGRYGHSVRVAVTAEHLARAHGLDPERARLAGLLHDAAREEENFLQLATTYGVPAGEPERKSPKLLHGPVAAELARRKLGVEDEAVLEAVRVHTTARPGMGPLALALYVADKIEPAREYPSVHRLRRLAAEDLPAAAAEALQRAISHNEQRGKETHPASYAALEWLEKG